MTVNGARYNLVRGRAARFTKVDQCGVPLLGPNSQVTTKGLITVAFTAETDAGTTVEQVNANGDTCVRDVPAPRFLDYAVEITACGVDPALIALLTGNATVLDPAGTVATGFKVNSQVDMSAVNFAIELWMKVPGSQCGASGVQYGYALLPYVAGGTLGDWTWQNDAIDFPITGARTQDGNAWGVGPYNVMLDTGGAPAPLPAVLDPFDHLFADRVTLTPPDTSIAGSQPVGVAATGAVAGLPGHFTPTNSYAPSALAGMTGVTASPGTAWTTGQYVTLLDGSKAHWTSAAWAAGAA